MPSEAGIAAKVLNALVKFSNQNDTNTGRTNSSPIRRQDVVDAYKAADGRCCYCHVKVNGLGGKIDRRTSNNAITIERINNDIPHRSGNITIACHRCNNSRGDRISHKEMRTET